MTTRRNWDRPMKDLLKEIFADDYKEGGSETVVHYGEGGAIARLDGVINGQKGRISVELERKSAKDIRGALMDLINHDSPMKLLILDPNGPANVEGARKMSVYILNKFVPSPGKYEVLVVDPDWPRSKKVSPIEEAAKRLGWKQR